METREAVALIGAAIRGRSGTWADVGAGDGTFTRALVQLLGPASRVYAIDRDRRALAALERWAADQGAHVVPVAVDFTHPFALPGLAEPGLDGMLFANSLHFVPDAGALLGRLARWVRPGGRLVIVEYDRRAASRWVPYPVPSTRLADLAAAARLTTPTIIATRPSAFGGVLYAAAADRLAPDARDAP